MDRLLHVCGAGYMQMEQRSEDANCEGLCFQMRKCLAMQMQALSYTPAPNGLTGWTWQPHHPAHQQPRHSRKHS